MENEFQTIVRDGVEVSAQLQELWAVELELFEQFKAVCEKHSLKYFASGGTLLGAVRHKGFIPWDDDIDVMMLREDYDKLLSVANNEFSEPYFFQTAYTDKNYYRGHAQLRKSTTTAALGCEALRVPFNQGIFIDIFPVDAIPDDPKLREKQRRALHSINRLLNDGARFPEAQGNSLSDKIKRLAVSIISVFYSHKKQYAKMERLCKMYNGQQTKMVGFISFDPNDDRLKYRRCIYDAAIQLPFEHTTISAPSGFDEMLRVQFDDYMVMKRVESYHGSMLVDTKTPYKDYIKNLKTEQK